MEQSKSTIAQIINNLQKGKVGQQLPTINQQFYNGQVLVNNYRQLSKNLKIGKGI